MLEGDLHVSPIRFGQEVDDLLVDVLSIPSVEILYDSPESWDKVDIQQSRPFLNLPENGLGLILSLFDPALREVPSSGVLKEKVLPAFFTLEVDHRPRRSLLHSLRFLPFNY